MRSPLTMTKLLGTPRTRILRRQTEGPPTTPETSSETLIFPLGRHLKNCRHSIRNFRSVGLSAARMCHTSSGSTMHKAQGR